MQVRFDKARKKQSAKGRRKEGRPGNQRNQIQHKRKVCSTMAKNGNTSATGGMGDKCGIKSSGKGVGKNPDNGIGKGKGKSKSKGKGKGKGKGRVQRWW
jgi:hypothetical protein